MIVSKIKNSVLLTALVITASVLFLSIPYYAASFIRNSVQVSPAIFELSSKISLLSGDWDFYPHQLLTPTEIAQRNAETKSIQKIPHTWEEGLNYGTYRFVVKSQGKNLPSQLGLVVPYIHGSYKIFINNELVLEAGKVSKDISKVEPFYATNFCFFPTNGEYVEVVMQVSSPVKFMGGLMRSPIIGESHDIKQFLIIRYGYTLFFVPNIFLITCALVGLLINRMFSRKYLYFILSSIFYSIRFIFASESEGVGFFLSGYTTHIINIHYLSQVLTLYFVFLYISHNYKDIVPLKKLNTLLFYLTIVCCIVIFFCNKEYLPIVGFWVSLVIMSLCFYGIVYINLHVTQFSLETDKYLIFGNYVLMISITAEFIVYMVSPIMINFLLVGSTVFIAMNALKFLSEFNLLSSSLTNIKSNMDSLIENSTNELKQKNNELEQSIVIDTLTQVKNRHYAADKLKEYSDRALIDKSFSYCIAIIDIDNFKTVNDTFGHQAGDDTLVTFAALIQKRVRSADTFARWGGEEFLLIMPNAPKEIAHTICERIRVDVEKRYFETVGKISASIGVGSSSDTFSPEMVLANADACLYKAKDLGRNTVISDVVK